MSSLNQDLWQLDSKLRQNLSKKPKKKAPGFATQKKVLEQSDWMAKTKKKKK